jgi:hypothetical protein
VKIDVTEEDTLETIRTRSTVTSRRRKATPTVPTVAPP